MGEHLLSEIFLSGYNLRTDFPWDNNLNILTVIAAIYLLFTDSLRSSGDLCVSEFKQQWFR